ELPSPGNLDEREIRSQTLRLFLLPSTPGPNLRCKPQPFQLVLGLERGKAFTVERANVLVAWEPAGKLRSRLSRLAPGTYRADVGPLRLRLVPEGRGVVLCT